MEEEKDTGSVAKTQGGIERPWQQARIVSQTINNAVVVERDTDSNAIAAATSKAGWAHSGLSSAQNPES